MLCANCGQNNPPQARFCYACGTPMEAFPEGFRKIVTIVFSDVVESTSLGERLDPEDLSEIMTRYFEAMKPLLERHGGTVAKFIGDAIMTVFGVPTAHEDDALRAIRAAEDMKYELQELNEELGPKWGVRLATRTGINTGEAAGKGVVPHRNFVAGDVANVAARLQQLAAPGDVLIAEPTYRLARDAITTEELEAISVKGKVEPITAYRVIAVRSRFAGDGNLTAESPLIGRVRELSLLKSTYQKVVRENSIQLVTITGEPGVGKTRLLAEFSSFIDEQVELVIWRQGRSLPYGEGVTFWALGEIVKAHAGILESDSPQIATDKLRVSVEAAVEKADERTWFVARLAPLVGAETTPSGRGGADREESFTAWRRFLEAIASRSPLLVVFEDLHWADPAMLKFIDNLVERSISLPLLVVCTARPELYEGQGGWGRSKRNSTTIALSPLSDSETSQLISALLSHATLPAEVHLALLERAGGNPLFAQEFVRMLSDKGVLRGSHPVLTLDRAADIPMPDNVQALIAARLDTLPWERKALIQDASVAGKVFWSGAVCALGERGDREVREGLYELARKEFVRPSRTSSMEGEQEYSFSHALVRDVAYGQIPRGIKGQKHRGIAEWIEGIAGERVGDHSEVLVHHYTQAFNLATVVGDTEAEKLVEPTARFLILAGDRATNLDVGKARDYFHRALELLPSGHSKCPPTLVKSGLCAYQEGSLDESQHYYERAIGEVSYRGDVRTQAQASLALSTLMWWKGDTARRDALIDGVIKVLEPQPPRRELAHAYRLAGQSASMSGRSRLALRWVEKAFALAQSLGDEKETMAASIERGVARCDLGDLEGLQDLRSAVQDGLRLGLGPETSGAYSSLGEWTWWIEGAVPAAQVYGESLQFAERRGLVAPMMHDKAECLRVQFDLGEWDEIDGSAGDLLRWSEEHGDHQSEVTVLFNLAQVLLLRGGADEAAALEERMVELAREIEDLQVLVPALAVASLIEQAKGDNDQAVALVGRLDALTRENHGWRARYLPIVIRILVLAGREKQADRFLTGMVVSATRDRHSLLTGQATMAEAAGRIEEARDLYHEAARCWADYGFVLEEGQAYFGLGRCLTALRDGEAARSSLVRARTIFERLGAVSLANEVDGCPPDTSATSG